MKGEYYSLDTITDSIDYIEGYNLQPNDNKVERLKNSIHTMTDVLIWSEKNDKNQYFEYTYYLI